MIPAHIFAGAEDWCRECDDQYLDADTFDGEGVESCETAGHFRLLDPTLLRWFICDRCKGEGFLRGYPGVYTADDFAEDPDLADDYMAFERTCEDCNGLGRVKGIDDEIVDNDPALQAWLKEMSDLAQVEAQERRYGA